MFMILGKGEKWRDQLPPHLDQELSNLIKEVRAYERAYNSSDSKANAQIWVALALMNKKLNEINQGIKRVQNGMEEAGRALTFREEKMQKILKALESL